MKVKKTGKTIDEAVAEALTELKVSREKVDVQVLEEGNRGFLGIGSRPCMVEVSVREEKSPKARKAETFLQQLLSAMGITNYHLKSTQTDATQLHLDLTGSNLGILIGKRGQTLNDLQYLVSLATNRGEGEYLRIILDVEGYRQKREESLTLLAHNIAQKVISQGRRKVLEPMNPQERRIIHTALQDNKDVCTFSEGKEPFRRVIIAPSQGENHS